MTPRRPATAALVLLALAAPAGAADPKRDALWAAVRAGDVKAVQAALDSGADVNARNEYGVTALWIAAGKPKPEVAELLVAKGADVNARDDIWYQTPLSSAVGGRQHDDDGDDENRPQRKRVERAAARHGTGDYVIRFRDRAGRVARVPSGQTRPTPRQAIGAPAKLDRLRGTERGDLWPVCPIGLARRVSRPS